MPENAALLHTGPAVWLLLVLLLAVAAGTAKAALGLPVRRLLPAGIRALLQLAVVAVAIASLGRSALLSAGFPAVMLLDAAWTSARRIGAGQACTSPVS